MAAEQVRFDIIIKDLGSGPLKKFASSANTSIGKVNKLLKSMNTSAKLASNSVGRMAKSINKIDAKGVQSMNRSLGKSAKQLDALNDKAKRLQRIMANVRSGNMNGGVSAGRGGGGGGKRGFASMAAAGFAHASGIIGPTAIIGGFAAAIKEGMELQNVMTDVRSAMMADGGFSESGFAEMSKGMKQLAVDTVFSGKEIWEGVKFLTMAGYDMEKINKTMPAIANIAAIEGMAIGDAADIISSIQSGYDINASKMSAVADVMTRTSVASKTSLAKMGETMKYASNQAASSGVEFTEFAAAIGALGNKSIDASMAGTNLRDMFYRMKAPTEIAAKALKKYNYQFTEVVDGKTKLKSLRRIIKEFKDLNVTEKDKKDIFGKYGGEAFNSISSTRSTDGKGLKIDEIYNLNKQSGGLSKAMADEKMKNFNGQWHQLSAQFEQFAVNVFVKFEPVLTRVMNALTKMFTAINADGSSFFERFGIAVAVVGNAMRILWHFLRDNWEMLKTIGLILGALTLGFYAYKAAVWAAQVASVAMRFATAGIAVTMRFLNITMMTGISTIGVVVAVLAVLAAAVVFCWNKFEGFRAVVFTVWEVIKTVGQGIKDFFLDIPGSIKGAFDGIVSFITKQLEPIGKMIDAIKNGEWIKAGKLGLQALYNLSPAGMVANGAKAINDSDAIQNAIKTGKARAKSGEGTFAASDLLKKMLPSGLGAIGKTGNTDSDMPVNLNMGPGANTKGGGGGGGSGGGKGVKSYSDSNTMGGIIINVENLFNIKTEKILDGLGADGQVLREALTKQFMAIIKDVEVSYGS